MLSFFILFVAFVGMNYVPSTGAFAGTSLISSRSFFNKQPLSKLYLFDNISKMNPFEESGRYSPF